MSQNARRLSLLLSLSTALVLVACNREAESALDDGSVRLETSDAQPRAFLAPGTEVVATMGTELDTERNKVGDPITATVAEDVRGANGDILIPRGAVLNGRVSASRESTGSDQPAVLQVEVASVTSGGRTIPLSAEVVQLDVKTATRDSGTETAVKVTAGAVAGAAVGRIVGDGRGDAIKGAVVGAGAGTAVALATKDGQAEVKPGARLVLRLTERLVVEQ